MKFSYNWICEYLSGKKPSAKKMADVLMFHSFEVDAVEKKGGDWMMDIKVLPNRICDCSCHLGMAREVAAITKNRLKLIDCSYKESAKPKTSELLKVKIEDTKDCARYQALIMLNVKVGPSPAWLKSRLEVCGLKSINNIVDATNYVMLEIGQPLHAFDYDKLADAIDAKTKKCIKQIIVRRAKKDETIQTLDKEKTAYSLNSNALVIADFKQAIAIAGIKGGVDTGVDKNTKNIVIEAANFYGPLIRKASQDLKLKTDASVRFENWLDPSLIDLAQDRAARLMQKLTGGLILASPIDVYPKKNPERKIILSKEKIKALLGLDIAEQEILSTLDWLGFKTKKVALGFEVSNISKRLDLNLPEDLIEEIGRITGYEKIKAASLKANVNIPEENAQLKQESELQDLFASLGFNEAYGYSFCGQEDQEIFGWSKESLVKVANPISQAACYLRPSLLPNLLKTAKRNLRFADAVNFFEIGKSFCSFQGVNEKKVLAGLMVRKEENKSLYFKAKGIIELIGQHLAEPLRFEALKATDEPGLLWHPTKTAVVTIGKNYWGMVGEIHPRILEKLGLKAHAVALELELEKLPLFWKETQFSPIAQYPAVERDISLWVPKGVSAGAVLDIANATLAKLTSNHEKARAVLISLDEEIAQTLNKNNFVIRITYQAKDRGLSAKNVNPKQQKLIEALEEQAGWAVRQ